MLIWQKHIAKRLIALVFFFFFCLYALYLIIDLSIHGVRFFHSASIAKVLKFYGNEVFSLFDFLAPLSFLLALIKVLYDWNKSGVIVALEMAGISKKKLSIPPLCIAALLSCFSLMNFEWIYPKVQEQNALFKERASKKKKPPACHAIFLDDGTKLVYQHLEKPFLKDVFWILSFEDIWHMKTFDIETSQGFFVTHLKREKNKVISSNPLVEKTFPHLSLNNKDLILHLVAIEHRSLHQLWKDSFSFSPIQKSAQAHFFYKFATSLLFFLIILITTPIVLRFSRGSFALAPLALALFLLLGLRVIMDGMLILAETGAIAPSLAIFGPLALLSCFFTPAFLKMR